MNRLLVDIGLRWRGGELAARCIRRRYAPRRVEPVTGHATRRVMRVRVESQEGMFFDIRAACLRRSARRKERRPGYAEAECGRYPIGGLPSGLGEAKTRRSESRLVGSRQKLEKDTLCGPSTGDIAHDAERDRVQPPAHGGARVAGSYVIHCGAMRRSRAMNWRSAHGAKWQ